MLLFADNGFQATGMADIVAGSGLSAGAVYRYFRSKDELIAAIVDRVLGEVAARYDELLAQEPVPDLADAVQTALEAVTTFAEKGPVDTTRIAVQAWAEALRNPAVHAVADKAYRTIRGYFGQVTRRAQEAGRIDPDADTEQLAAALFSLVLGYLLQRLLLGDVPTPDYSAAVRVLLGAGGSVR